MFDETTPMAQYDARLLCMLQENLSSCSKCRFRRVKKK
jgi:hypothetical protein